ncbi:histidine phosphatase family protein [Alkalihalophilus lindianensis]|uniref:Histidine phosphatase family protein n=1 Tax=Alkalihalophilus lindianensis TaxID=1630542 RepID=A0ABU3XFX2_9BACI|nr:histidine phosphatase family protein [Alkalihalophilus lindianensis]MDV2686805.1 histidine phosphatase family protein [Alkalihalophilus lindianensis]
MEISLIRHGRSQLTENNRITCLQFKHWVEKYDNHGVVEEMTLPSDIIEKVVNAKMVVTSDLKRAIHSANLLSPELEIISDPLFRETELPIIPFEFWNVELRPSIWAVILRLVWFCGYSNECESLTIAKLRAKKASRQLIDYADKHKSVVLVGHGFFNMLIAKELQKNGWAGKRKAGARHWNCTTYSFFNKRVHS